MQSKTKSRTFRRVKKKVPGNNTVMHYVKRNPKKAHCADCGVVLAGMKGKTPGELKKLPRSQRRPERPYGGKLCSKCTKNIIKIGVRQW